MSLPDHSHNTQLPVLPVTINGVALSIGQQYPKTEDRLVKAVALLQSQRIWFFDHDSHGEAIYHCKSSSGSATYEIGPRSCSCPSRKLCYHRLARGVLVILSANRTAVAFGEALAAEEIAATSSQTTQEEVPASDPEPQPAIQPSTPTPSEEPVSPSGKGEFPVYTPLPVPSPEDPKEEPNASGRPPANPFKNVTRFRWQGGHLPPRPRSISDDQEKLGEVCAFHHRFNHAAAQLAELGSPPNTTIH